MKCQKAEQWILLSDSGELGAWRARKLARHLASCTHCQDYARSLGALTRATRAWDAGQPGSQTVGAIRTGLLEARDRRTVWVVEPADRPFARPAWALAALLALLGAGLLWFAVARPGSEPAMARMETPSIEAPGAASALAWDDNLDAEIDALTDLLASSLTDQNGNSTTATTETDEDTIARELLELQGYTI